jgi:predicted DNA-binding transcriptional regulator YafY
VVASVERAIDNGIRLRIRYRSASSRSTRWRLVDPATMRLADEHLYLVAWDVESSSPKTFKLTRILALEETTEPVATHPPLDLDQLFANAVRIWTADPVDVAVKIHDGLGWLVREWPLHAKQSVDDLPNGDAIVRARVAGIAEATRWTLRWGRSAEALEPASLLAAVQQELAGASARYKRPPKQVVSPTVRRAERIIANDPPVTSRRST